MSRKSSRSVPLLSHVVSAVDRFAPFRLAESWDNVGLQIGDPGRPAGKILVGLEVDRSFLVEAKSIGAGTLLTHHPLIFQPLRNMAETTTSAQLTAEIIRSGMALVAAHTNFDSVAYGTNGVLADLLDLQMAGREFLQPARPDAPSVKYVVFVPKSHVDIVLEAIAGAGAGVIGNYTHCSFRSEGTGTFKPLAGAEPYSGKVGEISQETELRLECVCARSKLGRLIESVNAVHPYEEVAFDVYPLEADPRPRMGLGLVGQLRKPATAEGLSLRIKKAAGLRSIGLVGDRKKKVERVAICSGAGGSIVRQWRGGTADLLLTGEMTHHDCAEALHRGLPVILMGHWESEAIASERMADLLRMALAEEGFGDVDILVEKSAKSPVRRM